MQEENKKTWQIKLSEDNIIEIGATKAKAMLLAAAVLFVGAFGSAGYFYQQLSSYRAQQPEFVEYQEHKAEQDKKLQELLQSNENMLRDMAEINNLEKKLRRAIIRDVDNSKLSANVSTDSATGSSAAYTSGQGGNGAMDANSLMAILTAQNQNIKAMITTTKSSVSELLGEVEGKSGTMAAFPDKWPVDNGVISSNYGGRIDPVSGGYEYHDGLDIAADMGAPIYAAAAGTVEVAGSNGGYGIYAKINHGNGYQTAYGHMSSLAVNAGQQVAKGEIIGFVGSTGYSTGPHVHFEVMSDGQTIDPYYVVKQ